MAYLLDTNIIIYYFNGLTQGQQHKTKTPDAIIAATARIHQLQIATNNQSDFESLGVNTISIQVQ